LALGIVAETFAPYCNDMPFGLYPAEFVTYAGKQFDHRLRVLERAVGVTG
jgi:hypothetical protein